MAQLSVSPLSGSPTDKPFPSPALPGNATATTAAVPANTTAAPAKPKSKPRKRVNTAEKRHQHNAIERQRRETLNGKFFDLARLLPALAASRRPSKSAIVNGSIAHLTYQRDQRLLASRLLKQLSAERDALAKEVNEWRASSGFQTREITNLAEEIEEVCSVEQEVFGTFANVEDEPEDDDMPSEVASFNGLITPRPSTDINEMHLQSMFGNMPVPPVAAPATAPSMPQNWSNDFTFALNTSNVFPFNPFLADPVEPATSTSPASSQQGGVLTPQTFNEMMVNHTPSPRSSNGLASSVEDVKPTMQASQNGSAQWTPAQILLAQQLQRQQQQQQQQQQSQAFASHFAQPQVSTPAPLNPDLFSQQIMASMFANSLSNNTNAQPDQIELWRRAAIGSIPAMPMSRPSINPNPTSVHDLRQAVRVGMSMSPVWTGQNQAAVEGF